VVREAPSYDPSNYKGKHAFVNDNRPPRIIFGMKVRTFLVVALVVILVMVGAAVGGAVGGKSMRQNQTADGTIAGNLYVSNHGPSGKNERIANLTKRDKRHINNSYSIVTCNNDHSCFLGADTYLLTFGGLPEWHKLQLFFRKGFVRHRACRSRPQFHRVLRLHQPASTVRCEDCLCVYVQHGRLHRSVRWLQFLECRQQLHSGRVSASR
jgi:hypothetical protein